MLIADVDITNADREVYPDDGLTKGDVAHYIERVARLMLPHIAGRPLTFVRCPEGIGHDCFYQKHLPDEVGDAVERLMIKQKNGETKPYAVVHDLGGLLSLVQFGILEIHVWGSRQEDIDSPDRIVFDLDPDDDIHWETTVEAAEACRERLERLGLLSWPKTTGGKGLHIVAPLAPGSTWDDVRDFALAFAEDLVAEHPHDFLSEASKVKREGMIFIDWLRNGRGNTWVAPWSMRAKRRAPVSLPLSWASLKRVEGSDAATIATLGDGRRLVRDPWAAMLTSKQVLP